MLRAGDFFTGTYPPGSGKKRRFIVVTDEVAGEATVVWVYASTSTSDQTVLLQKGAHPEITQDCYVVYEEAEVAKTATITAAIAGGALTAESPLEAANLATVQDGLFVSEETPVSVQDYCHGRI